MSYESYPLKMELAIDKLYSFHYYELENTFVALGEQHDFWEFVYVDKGEVEITAGSRHYALAPGELVFYQPNEFHQGRAFNGTAPNLLIVSFDCRSPRMAFFENRLLRPDEAERSLLSSLLQEGFRAFDPPIDRRGMSRLVGSPVAPFGCEQLIKLYTEALLIRLIRRGEEEQNGGGAAAPAPVSQLQLNKEQALVDAVIAFMKQRLTGRLSADELCRAFAIGKTQLNAAFRARTGYGPMEYYQRLLIDAAKTLIREQSLNMTEIAERLGFASIHYFSRSFKRLTNMTPTEYARSVRARIGRGGTK
ncbi:AraC family transcriptional regulator [Paenibacillus cymbidii]|uniref:AraC family transcriptional regulator n=1 Tax=Paenibacillus cymbidii TaxID=1639034 RepID=UPI0014368FC5|nr:AraC family transcriptional regulator [Paenibacillus cymbidii]